MPWRWRLVEHSTRQAHKLLGRAGVWRYCFEGGAEFAALDPAVEARLRERFRPEVEALAALIGRDLSGWTRPRGAVEPPAPAAPADAHG